MNPYRKRFPPFWDEGGRDHRPSYDVYDVLLAFDVRCPATQHAAKKLLCAGQRGHKDRLTDLLEAVEAIERAIELEADATRTTAAPAAD